MTNNSDYSNYLFFWSKKHDFLSNFYPSEFNVGDQHFICSEQYFMKKKQELFDSSNIKLAGLIMNEKDPKKIKKFGRMVKNFDEEIWNQHKYQIMYQGVKAKFTSNPNLRKKLLETKNKILVEASPYDKIWGIGLNESNAKKKLHTEWPGKNLLGKVLMQVRQELI